MKGYNIRIMYGNKLKVFSFTSDVDDETAVEEFDKAVKSINKIYKEKGRFSTKEEVMKHFAKYGFYSCKA